MALRLRVLELEECRKLQCLGRDFVAGRVGHVLYVGRDVVGVVELHDRVHDAPKLVLEGVEPVARLARDADRIYACLLDEVLKIFLRALEV